METLIDLFKHILHLDFDWLFANYGTVIYSVLFLVIFIETGLVAMPFCQAIPYYLQLVCLLAQVI